MFTNGSKVYKKNLIDFFKLAILPFLLVFLTNCFVLDDARIEKRNANTREFALSVLGLPTIGDSTAKLYYAPLSWVNSPENITLLQNPTPEIAARPNKKLIFIHGWQISDKDIRTYPTEATLRQRISDLWREVSATDLFAKVSAKGYDIYFFTYLSSDPISLNGQRFRVALDPLFLNQTNSVYIYAHSMGGLLSKVMLYTTPLTNYVARIYAFGTPFHGSPWASPEFQKGLIFGELVSFLTSTNGGRDLAWSNYDLSLNASPNQFLINLSRQTSKDNLINTYYSSLDSNATGYLGIFTNVLIGCSQLGTQFSLSDCIVPARSAFYDRNTNIFKQVDMGKYTHLDINLRISAIRDLFLSELP